MQATSRCEIKETAIIDDDFDLVCQQPSRDSHQSFNSMCHNFSTFLDFEGDSSAIGVDNIRETSLCDYDVDVNTNQKEGTDSEACKPTIKSGRVTAEQVVKLLDQSTSDYDRDLLLLNESVVRETEEKPTKEIISSLPKHMLDGTDENDDTDSAYLSMLRSDDTSDFELHSDAETQDDLTTVRLHAEPDFVENVSFQDIESDFFDEDDEINTSSKSRKASKPISSHLWHIPEDHVISTERSPLATNNESKLSAEELSNIASNKTSVMSNNLLRSTIRELQNALNGTNRLLSERDEEINSIRARHAELKSDFDKVDDSCKQLREDNEKLKEENEKLRREHSQEKDNIRKEKDSRILELSNQLLTLSSEVDELKKYNEKRSKEIGYVVDDNSDTTALLPSQREKSNINACSRRSRSFDKQETSNAVTPSSETANHGHQNSERIDTNVVLRRDSTHTSRRNRPASMYVEGDGTTKNTRHNINGTRHCNFDRSGQDTEQLSQRELHAQLRMKFMRDAFFYYMIGFHPDEQMNAILSILDYGDKRQDVVLEAHKMRQSGKKFNASKVSTRGLTFVQTEFR